MHSNKSPSQSAATQQAARSTPHQGGTIEPANLAALARKAFQPAFEPPASRYELRDPFAEVTYRTSSFPEMVAKADHLGSSRFVAIDEQGQRTIVQKTNGRWPLAPPVAERQTSQADAPSNARPAHEAHPAPSTPAQHTRLTEPDPMARPSTAQAADIPLSNLISDAKAERAALITRIEAELAERYVIKRASIMLGPVAIGRTEYRYRGDSTRLAFTESQFRLATDSNNPSVARSMVAVAQARNWKALRVAGSEDFKRLVWLEANSRGVKALGYEPTQTDLELLKREREARLVNRIEPERTVAGDTATSGAAPKAKASERGAGGRKTVLAAIEAVLVAKGVPERQRQAVMVAAAEKLEQRIRAGQAPKVKVYDPSAPSQRPAVTPTPDKQRTRDRAAPTR